MSVEEEQHFYRFKSFRLDVEERLLLKNGNTVPLTPKAFDVLAALVERGGHLVEKNELLDLVWTDSFVEEANVARIIYTLRKTLGEDNNGNKFIETIAKKGYRFVAEVTQVRDPDKLKFSSGEPDLPDYAENPTAAGIQTPSFKTGEITPSPFVKPKQKPRLVLFAVGFLSAFFLLGALAFYLQFDNTNKVKSIAVLPVKPINTANRDELYEIGIADSLINRLNTTKNLIVRPLSATRQYTDITQDPITAGLAQKVDYVLVSNYQLADGKIRITAQLFNVASGEIEETYKIEKDAGSIFAMQDAVADEIKNVLFARFAVVPSNQTARRGTTNEEAYRLYLQGKNLTAKRNPPNSEKAIEYFEQAVLLDPNFARGYVGLAQAYTAFGQLNGMPREQYEKALESVNKALIIDDNLAEGYAARADLKLSFDWDFAGMESDLSRAAEIEPNSTAELLIRAKYFLIRGRFDEAVGAIDTVLEIDPTSIAHQHTRGRYLYKARRYDEAILQLKRIVETDENFANAYGILQLIYEKKGDYASTFDSFMEMIKRRESENIELYQKIYEEAGWQEVRRKFIEIRKFKGISANEGNSKDGNSGAWNYGLAIMSAAAGEKEQAFEFLYKAVEDRPYQMLELNIDPSFDLLRGDQRFDDLVRRVGLN